MYLNHLLQAKLWMVAPESLWTLMSFLYFCINNLNCDLIFKQVLKLDKGNPMK